MGNDDLNYSPLRLYIWLYDIMAIYTVGQTRSSYAQNQLHRFSFSRIDGEAAGLLRTYWQEVVVMEFGKRHDTTDTTDLQAPT